MSSVSTKDRSTTRVLVVRLFCSVLLTFTLFKFGGNLRLHGVPVYFYYDLIEKTFENDATENEVVPPRDVIDDASEGWRQHKEVLRQKRIGKDTGSDLFRDHFLVIGAVHEQRVIAEAYDVAHRENMKNYAITARYSQRTNHELTKEAEASRLTRKRLDELNGILSNEVRELKVLQKKTAESLDAARNIHEQLLQREKFIQEIHALLGRGPWEIIWEYVRWVFDLVLDPLIEYLLLFEAFILDDQRDSG